MAGKFLVLVAPFIAALAVWWLANRIDRIIHFLFPHWAWEKDLGWLNIQAERRANTALRWVGYGIYLLLAAALPGIAWGAVSLEEAVNRPAPFIMGDLAVRIPVLVVCLGAWLLFLGSWLFPKLRAEREEAALKKFRAQMAEAEAEAEQKRKFSSPSRVHSPLQKPRTNAPHEALVPDRTKRRRLPGG
jgi:hypothetical protein